MYLGNGAQFPQCSHEHCRLLIGFAIFILDVLISSTSIFAVRIIVVLGIEYCMFANSENFEIFEERLDSQIDGVIHTTYMHDPIIPLNSLSFEEEFCKLFVHLVIVRSIVGSDTKQIGTKTIAINSVVNNMSEMCAGM